MDTDMTHLDPSGTRSLAFANGPSAAYSARCRPLIPPHAGPPIPRHAGRGFRGMPAPSVEVS